VNPHDKGSAVVTPLVIFFAEAGKGLASGSDLGVVVGQPHVSGFHHT